MSRWVYCPRKGSYVAFSYCLYCDYLKTFGGLYRNDMILCGFDNSVRHIVKRPGEKPKEFRGTPEIFKRKRFPKEPIKK